MADFKQIMMHPLSVFWILSKLLKVVVNSELVVVFERRFLSNSSTEFFEWYQKELVIKLDVLFGHHLQLVKSSPPEFCQLSSLSTFLVRFFFITWMSIFSRFGCRISFFWTLKASRMCVSNVPWTFTCLRGFITSEISYKLSRKIKFNRFQCI